MSGNTAARAGAQDASITKSEREDLQRLVRQREKVLKSAVKQRSADLLADFENQLAATYHFDDDEIWRQAEQLAEQDVQKAQTRVAARCAELGIPNRFAPELGVHWHSRGENAVKSRRNGLRKVIQSIEARAIVAIELASANAQTEIATAGLTSAAAIAFIEQLPAVESLMPTLSIADMADEANPPIAEQLLTPNALRQRRHQERLRNSNGQRALQDRYITPGDDSEPLPTKEARS
jgi:hypothetical protein